MPLDLVQAYAWFYLAARSGDELFVRSRDNLAKTLTEKQLAEGYNLALDLAQQNGSR
jgi:hypothetical protein